MDNFRFDMTNTGNDKLIKALEWFSPAASKVIGYRVGSTAGTPRLIFYWAKSDRKANDVVPFPYAMTLTQAGAFAVGWVENVDYGKEPDHDGHNEKGWRIYNEAWGHVDDDWAAFCAIEPCWIMHGK